MNQLDCQQLIDSYLSWLKSSFSIRDLGDSCELTTPFLDRHNDHLQLYVEKKNGAFLLTDDGYILSDLNFSGMEFDTEKRQQTLNTIVKGFGVRLENDELSVEASERNIGQRIHTLVQAMLAVNDTFVLSKGRVASFFWEDVRQFLDAHDVRYSSRVKLSGRSGYDHAIDFLIPKSKQSPERLVQAINIPAKGMITNYLFALSDSRNARTEKSQAIAFLNDQEKTIGGDVLEALKAYDVTPAIWSEREKYTAILAA